MTIPQTNPEEAKRFFQSKIAFTTGPAEVAKMLKENEAINIVDVRAEKDFNKSHIPGAANLPQDEWASLNGLDKNKLNIIYCYSAVCHLAAKAARDFAAQGYRVMEMDGGFEAWQAHKFKVTH